MHPYDYYLYEGSPEDYGYYVGADALSYAQAPLHYAQELGAGIGTTLKQAAQGAQRGGLQWPTVPSMSNPFGGMTDVVKNLSPQGQLDAMQNDLSKHADKLQAKADAALRIADDTSKHVKDTSDTVKIAVIAIGALGAIAIIYSMVK